MSSALNPSELDRLIRFPREVAYDEVTPLHALPNLSRLSQGTQLYVKRDDCNLLAFGGNKVRQLEYYFGDAVTKGADTVLITGAVQSNFARITAAFAARLGMECHIQLESRVDTTSESYHASGNVLLNRLFGAHLHYFPEGENEHGADRRLREIADQLKAGGRTPYVIPLAPGHSPLGALGYVRAAAELLEQCSQMNLWFDEIYVASGSGNTHAGLLYGLRVFGHTSRLVGVCVRRNKADQLERIRSRCKEIGRLLKHEVSLSDEDIILTDEFLEPGYGKASDQVWKGIIDSARHEGLVLDPTYTGKVMAAFLAGAQSASLDSRLLFFHTGGTPGIFAYQDELGELLKSAHTEGAASSVR